ncbi:alpha/beta fold hydrolase [Salinicola aestuarinus]|uniref:alpha/beta fold hydrolase n=1 Tax=Salinicola aestuarinus TaxID=1949082 RepID=UPI000DA1BED9|nr:alpha/beta hydrolase [Salinicola aestuarinus]
MRPSLVFAHANGFTGASYRTLLDPLAERFSLYPLDCLAHDPAFPVDRNWSSLCDEYLDQTQGIPAPFIGVGHSMGGVLSIMAAVRAPSRFRAVVALDPPLLLGRDALALKLAKLTGFADRMTPARKALRRRDQWPSGEVMSRSLRQRALFRDFTDEAMADYVAGATEPASAGAVRLRFRPRAEAAVFRHLPDHLGGVLKRLEVPLIVLAGDRSALLTPPRRRALSRLGVTVHEVPGGHMFPFEHPEATRAGIVDALASLEALSHVG